MELKLKIKVDKDNFYQCYIRLMNSISKDRMSGREIDVLAEYMKEYQDILGMLPEERIIQITSTEMRKKIRDGLNINEKNMNNILSKLRKKGQLVSGKMKWFAPYDKTDGIIFKFDKDEFN